jgi:exodeoxyribonuclease VII large subunit
LRVGELTRYLKRLIEDDRLLTDLSIVGEVTDISRPGSGHVYFTLKDDASQLGCVLFRREVQQNLEELRNLKPGVNVVAEGAMKVYEPRGSYQLYVDRIQVQGAGAAQIRFQRLKKKLETEGLFAAGRKRTPPARPACVALITSPDSSAYHDVIHRLQKQWPLTKVIVAGASVQGDSAAGEIVLALDIVNRMTDAEVVLIVRGGGSPEELACFNDERLARSIFASRLPVVTGVGHQDDVTIVDLVADLRAATPSLAAAAVVPDGVAYRKRSADLQRELRAAAVSTVRRRRESLTASQTALFRASPMNRVRVRRQHVDELYARIQRLSSSEMQVRRRRVDALSRQLQALDPLGILARGYALITDASTGQVVASVNDATPGREITARVKDGSFRAVVGGDE